MPPGCWPGIRKPCYADCMERYLLIALAGILAASVALAQSAWRWTDENGVVHYSDSPVEGAEPVNLSEYTRDTGVRISHNSNAAVAVDEDATADSQFEYDSIAITSPAAEETLWNIEATLNVTVTLSPQLQPGHQLRAYFDGQPQDVPGPSFRLQNVYRGIHNLQVEVVDAQGRSLIRSEPTRFYVQQNSIAPRAR